MNGLRSDSVYTALASLGLNYKGSGASLTSPDTALAFLLNNFASDINGIVAEIFSVLPVVDVTPTLVTKEISQGVALAVWGGLCLKMFKSTRGPVWEVEVRNIRMRLSNVDVGSIVKPYSLSVAIHGLDPDFAEFGLQAPKLLPPAIDHVV